MLLVRSLPAALLVFGAVEAALGQNSFATGDTALAYDVYGDGPVIVLLAGGPGMNPAYVSPLAHMIAACGRRVVLLHQRGTGRSAGADSWRSRMTLSGAVADLEALRLHLNLERLTLAGHSWGGMLAMAYAQEHPDRVGGLLLIDTGPMNSGAEHGKAARDEHRKDSRNEMVRLRRSLPAGEPLIYETAYRLMVGNLADFDLRNGMRVLRAPVALIFGARDQEYYNVALIRKLQPDSRLTVIHNSGHYPWLGNAAATAEAVKASCVSMP